MAQIVLVHGAWHGAWCWRDFAARLTARGHGVMLDTGWEGVADRIDDWASGLGTGAA